MAKKSNLHGGIDDAQLALANAFLKATRAIIMASKAETGEEGVGVWELWEEATADFDLATGIMRDLMAK